MLRSSTVLFGLLFCIVPYILQSQTIKQGQFKYECLSIEAPEGSGVDSSMIAMAKDNLNQGLNSYFYFKPDHLAIISIDFSGDTTRYVANYKKNEALRFNDVNGVPCFFIESMPEEHMSKGLISNDLIISKKSESVVEEHFGLNCIRHFFDIDGQDYEIVLTHDFIFPDFLQLNSLYQDSSSTLVKISTTDKEGFKMQAGIVNFSTVVDDKIFSMDTTNLLNKTKFSKDIRESFSSLDELEAENLEKYGEFKAEGRYNDIIELLGKEGIIDTVESWGNDYVDEYLNSDRNIDIPTLIVRSRKNLKLQDKDERFLLKEKFERVGILSHTVSQLLTDFERWDDLSDETRQNMVCLAFIKDHLNTKAARKQIVDNMITLNYLKKGAKINTEFVEGKVSLQNLFGSTEILSHLEVFDTDNKDLIIKTIKRFYDLVFKGTSVNIEIYEENDVINITDGNHIHQIIFNDLKQQNYDKTDYNVSPPEVVYFDTISINSMFYNELLIKVGQISVDNNIGNAYSIYEFKVPFVYEIDEWEYKEAVNLFPVLNLEVEGIFLQKFPKELFDPFQNIGTSFAYHPDGINNEVNLGSLTVGDGNAGVDYITTDKKISFFKYLENNFSSFNMTIDQLEEIERQINPTLFRSSDELLMLIPNIRVATGFADIQADPAFKSDYKPPFSEEYNDFKNVYPSLHRVVQDDFNATDFRYDAEKHLFYFKSEDKEFSVPPGVSNMINFIQQANSRNKKNRKFYKSLDSQMSSSIYYYMTREQRESLRTIIPINF